MSERRRALSLSPHWEVGDAQDQRAAVGDAGETVEAAEGPAAGLLLIGAVEHALRGVGDELHAREHGEEAGSVLCTSRGMSARRPRPAAGDGDSG